MVCSFLDVRERQSTVGIGDVNDLIKPRHRVTHVFCVCQWFLTLLRKRVDAVWQVALRREQPVFLMRLPSCFRHVFVHPFLNTWHDYKRNAVAVAKPLKSRSRARRCILTCPQSESAVRRSGPESGGLALDAEETDSRRD